MESSEENIKFNLENLKLQHRLTMNNYLNQDYDYLYEGVSITLYDYQYIPNWLPDKKDTNLVRRLANTNSQMVSLIIELIAALLCCTFEHSGSNLPIISNSNLPSYLD